MRSLRPIWLVLRRLDDYVEIPIDGVGEVVGGELNLKRMKKVKETQRKHHRKATIHCPGPLDLGIGISGP